MKSCVTDELRYRTAVSLVYYTSSSNGSRSNSEIMQNVVSMSLEHIGRWAPVW